MIHHPEAIFNPKESTATENIPDMAALRAVWRSLRTQEATATRGERMGIARRRQELLSVFPAWMLPDVIDTLNAESEEALA